MTNNISAAIANLPISSSQLEQLTSQGSQAASAGQASIGSDFGSRTLTPAGVESTISSTASEFESIFLSMMLKEMRNTLEQGEGGMFGGEGSDTFGGMFDMFMGQHMAESNPLGIGNAIDKYMQNSVS